MADVPHELPPGLVLDRVTRDFTQDDVPRGLLSAHRVATGVWGRLIVRAGSLTFVFEGDVSEGDVSEDDVSEGDVSGDDVFEGDVSGDDVSEGDVSGDDVSEGDPSEDDVFEGDVIEGDVSEDDVSERDVAAGGFGLRRRMSAGDTQVIPPGRLHHLELTGPARFAVEFHVEVC